MEGVAKKNQTIWRKIVPTKPNAQTAKRIIQHFQKLGREKEIMEVKYIWNIKFLEEKKIVEYSMKDNKDNTLANVVQKSSLISNNNTSNNKNNNQLDKYRALIYCQ